MWIKHIAEAENNPDGREILLNTDAMAGISYRDGNTIVVWVQTPEGASSESIYLDEDQSLWRQCLDLTDVSAKQDRGRASLPGPSESGAKSEDAADPSSSGTSTPA